MDAAVIPYVGLRVRIAVNDNRGSILFAKFQHGYIIFSCSLAEAQWGKGACVYFQQSVVLPGSGCQSVVIHGKAAVVGMAYNMDG